MEDQAGVEVAAEISEVAGEVNNFPLTVNAIENYHEVSGTFSQRTIMLNLS